MFRFLWATVLLLAQGIQSSAALPSEQLDFSSTTILADSDLGQKLLKNARQLENGGYSTRFLKDYEIKYLGCHHMLGWAGDGDDGGNAETGFVANKQLVKFRLCPAGSCSSRNSNGCKGKNYGDYVVDMYTFLDTFLEAQERSRRSICEKASYECNCDDRWRDDDGTFTSNYEFTCKKECYQSRGLKDCLAELKREEQERYYGRNEDEFRVEEAAECRELGGNRRRLDNNNNFNYYNNYFMGPYCARQGGDIYMGVFLDETCTVFADSNNGANTYKQYMYGDLPYKSTSIVSRNCASCAENRWEEDDDYVELDDGCLEMYGSAGKCETYMPIDYPVDSACSFVNGLKTLNEKGYPGKSGGAVTVTFTVLFALATCTLAAYVYYLRQKL